MRQWYLAYDVTGRVVPGEVNSVAVVMAAGWQSMGGHTLSARVALTMTDTAGTVPTCQSDPCWLVAVCWWLLLLLLLLVASCWLLVAGCWLLVASCWLLVAGC